LCINLISFFMAVILICALVRSRAVGAPERSMKSVCDKFRGGNDADAAKAAGLVQI